MGSKGVADFPLSKSGVAGSFVSSGAILTQSDLARIRRGTAPVRSHNFETVFDGEKWLDCDDDPGTTGVDDRLRAFKRCIGALEGSLRGRDTEFSLALDVLQYPQ